MKLYLLWDMERASGLFTRDQAWYWEPGVSPETAEAGRRLLIADVNAASAAAPAASNGGAGADRAPGGPRPSAAPRAASPAPAAVPPRRPGRRARHETTG
jgi:hypothetical protein